MCFCKIQITLTAILLFNKMNKWEVEINYVLITLSK